MEQVCGVCNDLTRLSNMVGDYRNELERKVTASTAQSVGGISVVESLQVFDDVAREYLELAFKSTELLARTVLIDVLPTIHRHIGSRDWEYDGKHFEIARFCERHVLFPLPLECHTNRCCKTRL